MSYIDLFKTLREKFSNPKCDDPAGCANSKENEKLKGALDESDPQRKSQVLPQFATMVDQIMQILGTIGMGGGGGGGGGGSGGSGGGSPADTSNTTTNSTPLPLTTMAIADMSLGICGAMELEAEKRGLQLIVDQFSNVSVVDSGNSNGLANDYQLIFTNAFANLQSDALVNTSVTPTSYILIPPPIPVMNLLPREVGSNSVYLIQPFANGYTPYDNNIYGTPLFDKYNIYQGELFNLPSPIVDTISDSYYCQFYANTNNPHPGWAEFHYMADYKTVVYTLANTSTIFESYDQAVRYDVQTNFLIDIDPYMQAANLTSESLTIILDEVLRKYIQFSHDTLFGNNALSQMSQNMLPVLQNMVSTAKSDHLPQSVLNQGLIQQLLQNHEQNCSKARQCTQLAKQALQPQQDQGSS